MTKQLYLHSSMLKFSFTDARNSFNFSLLAVSSTSSLKLKENFIKKILFDPSDIILRQKYHVNNFHDNKTTAYTVILASSIRSTLFCTRAMTIPPTSSSTCVSIRQTVQNWTIVLVVGDTSANTVGTSVPTVAQ